MAVIFFIVFILHFSCLFYMICDSLSEENTLNLDQTQISLILNLMPVILTGNNVVVVPKLVDCAHQLFCQKNKDKQQRKLYWLY